MDNIHFFISILFDPGGIVVIDALSENFSALNLFVPKMKPQDPSRRYSGWQAAAEDESRKSGFRKASQS
jgi:hypothetical protein